VTALILTSLLAGLRADELLRANVGDVRRTDAGAVVHVRGKGGKDRRIPVESPLVEILERYLDSRASRFRPRACCVRDAHAALPFSRADARMCPSRSP
jgi:integrase